MTRENFFKKELAKLLYLKENEIEQFTLRYTKFIKKELTKGSSSFTKALMARGLVLILRNIREKREEQKQKKVLTKIRHKCLLKHWEKFLELHKMGLGAKRMERYFAETLHCKITFPTIQKAINLIKEQEEANG